MSKTLRRGAGTSQDVIHIVDENLRHGFAQLPRPVLRAKGLSDKAKLVYALLLDYAWREGSCFPGQLKLAEDLDTSDRTIRRALEELKGFQLIDWKQRGLSQTNIYFILSVAQNPRLTVGAPLFEPDRTKMSGPERTKMSGPERTKTSGQDRIKMSGPDRTKTSNKEYTEQRYPVEEYEVISKEKNPNVFLSNYASGRSSTKLRVQRTVDNSSQRGLADAPSPVQSGPQKPSRIGQILTQQYPHTLNPERSDAPSARGRPPKVPAYLAATMEDIAAKLHDENPRSSLSRAARLWKGSGLPEDKFVQRLHEASTITRQQGTVAKRSSQDKQLVNRMPYFFAVVEDLLGLKQEGTAGS